MLCSCSGFKGIDGCWIEEWMDGWILGGGGDGCWVDVEWSRWMLGGYWVEE